MYFKKLLAALAIMFTAFVGTNVVTADDGTPRNAGWFTGHPNGIWYVSQEFWGPSGYVDVDIVCEKYKGGPSKFYNRAPKWKAYGTLWVTQSCTAEYPVFKYHYVYMWG